MTIRGSQFISGAFVQFGTAYSTETTVKDDTTITARVPPSFGAFHPTITVQWTDGRTTTLTNAFSYGDCGGKRRAAGH